MPHSSFQVAIVFFGGEELLLLLLQLLLLLLVQLLLLPLVQLLLLLLALLSPVNPAGPNISFPFRRTQSRANWFSNTMAFVKKEKELKGNNYMY
jgi:hypothetical protein